MNLDSGTSSSVVTEFDRAVALFRAQRLAQAQSLCREMLSRRPGDARVLHLLGLILADRGEIAEALTCMGHALQLDPDDPALLGAHALILLRANQLDAAETQARAALTWQPQWADLLDILGSIRWRRGDLQEARACFEQALKVAPAHAGATGNLALLEERVNHIEAAERIADAGLKRNLQDLTLRLVKGRCLRRRDESAAAKAVFEALAHTGTAALQRDVEYELALCCDSLGEVDAAYAHAERANHLARHGAQQMLPDARLFMAQIHGLRARFSAEWVAAWQLLEPVAEPVSPAFLVGFPRSGTTLLDSMLGAHPGVTVLEERPTDWAMVALLERLPGQYPAALRTLTQIQRADLIHAYLEAAGPAPRPGDRLLDKSPFLTVHLGLVQRVFPGAPIIFMLRHPCDVVWSCFMNNLELNSGTAHFTRLNSTVDLYCSVMELWRRYRDVLPLNFHLVHYETLLDSPRATLQQVLDFLKLPWADEVLSHPKHVATRGYIKSASYAQVSRPLYQNSRDRWRRYAEYLGPYLPRLRPWCEEFGYAS